MVRPVPQSGVNQRRGMASAAGPPVAELRVDGGASATLLVAYRQGGGTASEATFEHGLPVLIDGTATALAETTGRRRG